MSDEKKTVDVTQEDGFRYIVKDGIATFTVEVITPKGNKLWSWAFTRSAGIREAERLIREVKEGSKK